MTQGWRRFTWKQIKGEEKITLKYPVETYMNIKGKVKKSDRNVSIANGFVTFIIKAEDSTTILITAYLTDKGEFIVDSLTFKNKAQISYEGTDSKSISQSASQLVAYLDRDESHIAFCCYSSSH